MEKRYRNKIIIIVIIISIMHTNRRRKERSKYCISWSKISSRRACCYKKINEQKKPHKQTKSKKWRGEEDTLSRAQGKEGKNEKKAKGMLSKKINETRKANKQPKTKKSRGGRGWWWWGGGGGYLESSLGGKKERMKKRVCLLVGCLTSQQHASVSQGRICSDNLTCCHTEIEAADQTFHLTQSQYTDTGPTSPSADPITPGAWQGSHWSANF